MHRSGHPEAPVSPNALTHQLLDLSCLATRTSACNQQRVAEEGHEQDRLPLRRKKGHSAERGCCGSTLFIPAA